jgi:hypothetical protein
MEIRLNLPWIVVGVCVHCGKLSCCIILFPVVPKFNIGLLLGVS